MNLNLPPPISRLPSSRLPSNLSSSLGHSLTPSSFSHTPPATSINSLMHTGPHAPVTSVHSLSHNTPSAGSSPVTSIHDLNNSAHTPTTSIAHDAKYSIADTQSESETQDELRHNYAQRQQVKAAAAQKHDDAYTFKISGTGHQFHDKGASGDERHMRYQFHHHRGDFKEMQETGLDKAIYKIVKKRMEHKTTGTDITRRDRIAMKKEVRQAIRENNEIRNKRGMNLKSKKIINQLKISKPGDSN